MEPTRSQHGDSSLNSPGGVEPMVLLDNVTIRYAQRGSSLLAVDAIGLKVPEGQFLAVVGPSGCGKSTMLKAIAGLLSVQPGGRLAVAGREVKQPPFGLSMMFQTPVLLDWLSVIDNVGLPLEAQGVRRAEARRAARLLLARAGLEDFASSRPYQLSGGMQQRVALCRSLVVQPKLLLMDEPFGALDAMTRDAMGLFLQDLWLDFRVTVILVTHSISEAVFLADRVLVLSPRPARIVGDVAISQPRPRTVQDRSQPTLQRYVAEITSLLDPMGVLGGPSHG